MAFALVYTAEHYLVDVLLGWVYTLLAFWAVNHLAERLAWPRFVWRSDLGARNSG
jgi:hypothetical protein